MGTGVLKKKGGWVKRGKGSRGYWVLCGCLVGWHRTLNPPRLSDFCGESPVYFFIFFYSLISSSPPSLPAPSPPRLSPSYSYLLCLPAFNEKQLVCGVSLRAWPCVRVRPCDEMATALIVWHRAAAALCQKSSSDSPTGMMAHLTNASPQSGPTMPGPTDRRKSGCGTVSDGYGFNSAGSDLGRQSKKKKKKKQVTRAWRASAHCVFYSKSSILCTCTTCTTPPPLCPAWTINPPGVFTHIGRDTSKGDDWAENHRAQIENGVIRAEQRDKETERGKKKAAGDKTPLI